MQLAVWRIKSALGKFGTVKFHRANQFDYFGGWLLRTHNWVCDVSRNKIYPRTFTCEVLFFAFCCNYFFCWWQFSSLCVLTLIPICNENVATFRDSSLFPWEVKQVFCQDGFVRMAAAFLVVSLFLWLANQELVLSSGLQPTEAEISGSCVSLLSEGIFPGFVQGSSVRPKLIFLQSAWFWKFLEVRKDWATGVWRWVLQCKPVQFVLST